MEQAKIVLCDPDVIIEFYRNNPDIISELKKTGQKNISVSIVTNTVSHDFVKEAEVYN